jgi:hypothetical protein
MLLAKITIALHCACIALALRLCAYEYLADLNAVK